MKPHAGEKQSESAGDKLQFRHVHLISNRKQQSQEFCQRPAKMQHPPQGYRVLSLEVAFLVFPVGRDVVVADLLFARVDVV